MKKFEIYLIYKTMWEQIKINILNNKKVRAIWNIEAVLEISETFC